MIEPVEVSLARLQEEMVAVRGILKRIDQGQEKISDQQLEFIKAHAKDISDLHKWVIGLFLSFAILLGIHVKTAAGALGRVQQVQTQCPVKGK